ncbi:hypothetical protein P22_0158 [Propionispora sp. 2/2-37]|uniref:shikimate kinase n=1 Tax=Propionispora sp. 2/2-37 TaxID=1677858 RepID=UPI0006BB86C8|nr:shikimate kinase [Propionispora sp. 2/2-37]CUH94096.1 hypothetical protein P22_0158 [Propionispora sp. 2/2-37]
MKNIVLIGFMGTGKTSTGRLLASRLGRPFIDTDKRIETDNGISIPDMFTLYGEAYFRKKEKDTIAKVARYTNVVIATGGGAVLAEENVNCLKINGLVITLTASVEVILERTGRRSNRPLLNCDRREQQVIQLLAARDALYKNAADFIIDTTVRSPQQVTEEIIVYLRRGGHLRGRS